MNLSVTVGLLLD